MDRDLLAVLGEEVTDTQPTVKLNAEITKYWKIWMEEGLPEDAKKDLLQRYPRNSELLTDAPKVNVEIVRHMTDIAKKRDNHFLDTQNSIGKALLAIGSSFSLLSKYPEEGFDHTDLLRHIWASGKLLSDVFHQQSIARKSFITPTLDKDIKATLDASISDEWLYGNKLTDQVNEAKSISRVAASLKPSDKPLQSKKPQSKSTFQGNFRRPPVNFRQVGNLNRSNQFTNARYRPRAQMNRPLQTRPARGKFPTVGKKY